MVQSVRSKAERLSRQLNSYQRVVIAFSGGVDSSVVAAAAKQCDLDTAIAVTAVSPSVPRWQIDLATQIATEIGIEHHTIETREGDRGAYRRNDMRRCFYCKESLYTDLIGFAKQVEESGRNQVRIVSGTNADDLGDYRPGIEAGGLAGVETPLADLEFTKADVRELATFFGLSNADLPASPCLASRIAYGVEVTPERLQRIEQAEDLLRLNGLTEFRVRLHAGELARVEVLKEQIPQLLNLDARINLTAKFQSLGFRFVTVDLEGFRSGSMNRVLVNLNTTHAQRTTRSAETTPAGETPL